ncbi:MAG: ACT domain-containing protein [Anaerolineales bacterium]|nr:ACT domain-containing protein [Anaerolineales bacterium]
MEKIKIGGILCHQNLGMLCIQGLSGSRTDSAASLLFEFGAQRVNIQFIVQLIDQHGKGQLTLAVAREDMCFAFDLVSRLQKQIGINSVKLKMNIASIGIYGPDFRVRPGIAGNFLKCLAGENIPVFAVSTSVSTCSALIPESEASKARSAMEAYFLLP